MFSRFTNILNALKNLGKIYSAPENVRKILRSHKGSHKAFFESKKESKKYSPKSPSQKLTPTMRKPLMKMMLPISHKYKSFIKTKKQFKKHFTNQKESKGEKSKNDKIICYECK